MKIAKFHKLLELSAKQFIGKDLPDMVHYALCLEGYLTVMSSFAIVRCPFEALSIENVENMEGKLIGLKTLKTISENCQYIKATETGLQVQNNKGEFFFFYAGILKQVNEYGRQDFECFSEETGTLLNKIAILPSPLQVMPEKKEGHFARFGIDAEVLSVVAQCFSNSNGKYLPTNVNIEFTHTTQNFVGSYPTRAMYVFPIDNTDRTTKGEHAIIMPSFMND